jgi:hypothetical protein
VGVPSSLITSAQRRSKRHCILFTMTPPSDESEPIKPVTANSKDLFAPETLFRVTYASIALSLVLLVFLAVWGDRGASSFFIGPTSACVTIVYHTIILLMARGRPPVDGGPILSPATTRASVLLACVLAFTWMVAMTLTSVHLNQAKTRYTLRSYPPLMLQSIESGVMLVIAVMTMMARSEKPRARQWTRVRAQ